jgi:hypothetical protein
MSLALDRMKELWENSPMSASQIGARYRTTKNSVIGQANRNGWQKRGERHPKASARPQPASTVFTRCDAWNAFMDRVLAETRPFVEDRKPVVVRVWPDDPERRLKAAARLRAMNQRGAE